MTPKQTTIKTIGTTFNRKGKFKTTHIGPGDIINKTTNHITTKTGCIGKGGMRLKTTNDIGTITTNNLTTNASFKSKKTMTLP